MIRQFVLIFVIGFLMISCGGNGTTSNKQTTGNAANPVGGEVVERYNGVSKDEADRIIAERAQRKADEIAQNLPGYRAHCVELIREREKTEKAMSFLVVDHWVYEFVFSGTEMSKVGEYEGQWIKYEDDHTYKYGHYNDIKGSGQYHYSLEQGKMIMVDDSENVMPEEWEVKAQDEVMILVGSGYFGNNPRQCKMLRWNGRPVAPAG